MRFLTVLVVADVVVNDGSTIAGGAAKGAIPVWPDAVFSNDVIKGALAIGGATLVAFL